LVLRSSSYVTSTEPTPTVEATDGEKSRLARRVEMDVLPTEALPIITIWVVIGAGVVERMVAVWSSKDDRSRPLNGCWFVRRERVVTIRDDDNFSWLPR
jgi:hypothetical protein